MAAGVDLAVSSVSAVTVDGAGFVHSASLACVSPTDVTYTTLLPAEVLSSGVLSRVQLEAVIYVLQQHEKMLPSRVRAGSVSYTSRVAFGKVRKTVVGPTKKRPLLYSVDRSMVHHSESYARPYVVASSVRNEAAIRMTATATAARAKPEPQQAVKERPFFRAIIA